METTPLLPAVSIKPRGSAIYGSPDGTEATRKRSISHTSHRSNEPDRLSRPSSIKMIPQPEQYFTRKQSYIDQDRGRGRPKISVVEERERAKLSQFTRILQLRLQYAKLKVEHGWSSQSLNEVENLYFHHRKNNKDLIATVVKQEEPRPADSPSGSSQITPRRQNTPHSRRRRAIVLANPALTHASIEAAQGKSGASSGNSYADFWRRIGDRDGPSSTASGHDKPHTVEPHMDAHQPDLSYQPSSTASSAINSLSLNGIHSMSSVSNIKRPLVSLSHLDGRPHTPPDQIYLPSQRPTPAPTPSSLPSESTAMRLLESRQSPTPNTHDRLRLSDQSAADDHSGTKITLDNSAALQERGVVTAKIEVPDSMTDSHANTGLMSPRSPEDHVKP